MRSVAWFLAIVVVAGGWWLLGGEDDRRTIPTARIVYTFRSERMRGTNTQHMRLTSQDRAALEALAAELKKR